jgi:hypothetical protein
MKQIGIVVLAQVAILFGPGCAAEDFSGEDRQCKQAGCFPGLRLELHAGGQDLPDGHYVIEALADGRDATIDLLIQDNLIACPVNRVDCWADLPAGEGRELHAWLDLASGDPATGFVLSELRVSYFYTPHPTAGTVDHLTIRILHDGLQVAAAELAPSYHILEPNGPGCGTCLIAQDDLVMNLPATEDRSR